MDAPSIALAEACHAAAHDGSMSFPAIVAALIEAGFEAYEVDYRRNTTTWFRPDGDSITRANRHPGGAVAARFDQAAMATLVRWAQAAAPDYSYAAFSARARALGCAGYLVSFLGRRVLYIGRTAETHVEAFPS